MSRPTRTITESRDPRGAQSSAPANFSASSRCRSAACFAWAGLSVDPGMLPKRSTCSAKRRCSRLACSRQARQVTLSASGEVIAYGTRSPHPLVTRLGRSPSPAPGRGEDRLGRARPRAVPLPAPGTPQCRCAIAARDHGGTHVRETGRHARLQTLQDRLRAADRDRGPPALGVHPVRPRVPRGRSVATAPAPRDPAALLAPPARQDLPAQRHATGRDHREERSLAAPPARGPALHQRLPPHLDDSGGKPDVPWRRRS